MGPPVQITINRFPDRAQHISQPLKSNYLVYTCDHKLHKQEGQNIFQEISSTAKFVIDEKQNLDHPGEIW